MAIIRYDRAAVVRYAYRYVGDPNPQFANMDMQGAGGDCTNFTSQCLLAGGRPMDYRRTGYDTEWWYRRIGSDPLDAAHNDWWSCTWSLPSLLVLYLQLNGGRGLDLLDRPSRARQLRVGDVVFYDWNGDGLFDHSAVVTRRVNGVPYVTYRTLAPLRPIRNGHWRLRFRRRARAIRGVLLPNEMETTISTPNWSALRPCESGRA